MKDTKVLKLTRKGDKIAFKIAVETEVDADPINVGAESVMEELESRVLKALRNIIDHAEVMIDSSGKLTCVPLPEAAGDAGDGEE